MSKDTLITMKIKVYWRREPQCPFCERAKDLLATREIEHELIEIGVDISRDEVKAKFPQATTVPVVTVNDRYIGGFTELQNFITTNNATGENYGNPRDKF